MAKEHRVLIRYNREREAKMCLNVDKMEIGDLLHGEFLSVRNKNNHFRKMAQNEKDGIRCQVVIGRLLRK